MGEHAMIRLAAIALVLTMPAIASPGGIWHLQHAECHTIAHLILHLTPDEGTLDRYRTPDLQQIAKQGHAHFLQCLLHTCKRLQAAHCQGEPPVIDMLSPVDDATKTFAAALKRHGGHGASVGLRRLPSADCDGIGSVLVSLNYTQTPQYATSHPNGGGHHAMYYRILENMVHSYCASDPVPRAEFEARCEPRRHDGGDGASRSRSSAIQDLAAVVVLAAVFAVAIFAAYRYGYQRLRRRPGGGQGAARYSVVRTNEGLEEEIDEAAHGDGGVI